ncbi:MAG: hypothetical protein Q4D23_11055 [Bacteroidales bacterium]|nr:hypothetical protein [Bacteroidales bacterium]
MKVKELIEQLQKEPQEQDVIMFDGPSYYTPYKVETQDWRGEKVTVID